MLEMLNYFECVILIDATEGNFSNRSCIRNHSSLWFPMDVGFHHQLSLISKQLKQDLNEDENINSEQIV